MNKPSNVGGADVLAEVLAQLAPIDPPPARMASLRERIMARAAAPDPSPYLSVPSVAALPPDAWKPIGPGLLRHVLVRNADTFAFLLKMSPGAVLPAHPHRADEECWVLEGQLSIETPSAALALDTGAFHFAPKGTDHPPITTRTGCVLYLRTANTHAGGRADAPA
jgi:anti-sigma factor ChrR (cupin superfamily)